MQNELLIIFLCIIVILIGFIDDLKNIKAITKLILISLPVIYFIVNISEVSTLGSLLSYNINLGKFGFFFYIHVYVATYKCNKLYGRNGWFN